MGLFDFRPSDPSESQPHVLPVGVGPIGIGSFWSLNPLGAVQGTCPVDPRMRLAAQRRWIEPIGVASGGDPGS